MAGTLTQLEWGKLRVHFVAVGGIGMSALARIAMAKGAQVSGCDSADSPTLAELRAHGCTCHVGHSPAHLKDVDMVVYSSAVPLDSPELKTAIASRLNVVSRGRMLALLQHGHQTVAVSGTHGKTTTTWIIANMLIRCGLDPSVAVGGIVPDLGGNWRVGAGRFFVTEADESDSSFLFLVPRYPVITNIDADHLDHYGGIEQIKQAFVEFAETAAPGAVIACVDCPNVREILPKVAGRKITCGVGQGDIAAHNVRLEPHRAVCDVTAPGGRIKDLVFSMPGMHNVRNSLAALALAVELGLPMEAVREAFAHTCRVGRRLEQRGTERGVSVYDDYAHHPAEIQAMLEAARALTPGRLIGIFQPHRYTRTLHLHREFGACFGKLDLLLLAPIYAASEDPIKGVSSGLIAKQIDEHKNVKCELLQDLSQVPDRLAGELAPGDTVITIGAGDVWKAGDAVLARLRRTEIASVADAAGM